MRERTTLNSGAVWEDLVGYSRAVRVGQMVFVSGTTAADSQEGKPVGGDSPHLQTMEVLRRIESALEKLGGGLDDVVRTRIFVTDISNWKEIGEAHRSFFGEIKPASTLVQVDALISPDLLVEIEVEAIVPT